MSELFAQYAQLPDGLARDVRITIQDGRFSAITPDAKRGEATVLPGVVLPGFANAHSHAFHRALRGRTHSGGGTFWTWREAMYALAAQLDPDSYFLLARAVYAEMALAGVSCVGEFHYLHHDVGGARYADPNAMSAALVAAAAEAGIRITLLDTCYLAGGLDGVRGHLSLDPVQRRFSDGSVAGWWARVSSFDPSTSAHSRVGAAVHSVRAVPADDIALLVKDIPPDWALHVHLSEQPAENSATEDFYGRSPTLLLDDRGALSGRTTLVHATHVDAADIAVLGERGTTACLCPGTERDLADGIGPARALSDAGVRLSLGSDQNASIDLLDEARGVEHHERLASLQRGRFTPQELISALTAHESLGWADAGAIATGRRADLVAVRTDTVRTAGADPAQLVLAATAADIDIVYVDGERVVQGGVHRLGEVGHLLREAIEPLWTPR